jgi:hypothetical protein
MSLLALLLVFASPAPMTEPPRIPIGMNLAGIADWEYGFPFRNLMWGSRKWLTRNAQGDGPWDTGKADSMAVDADGYPAEAPFIPTGGGPAQIPFTILPSVRPSGRYVVRWKGDGEIGAGLAAKVVEQSKNRAVLQITISKPGEDVVVLSLLRSSRANPVRDVTVVSEKDDAKDLRDQPFLPEFLRFVKPFSVLRFMDWSGTNGSIQQHIQDRKRPTAYTMVATRGDLDGTYGPKPSKLDVQLSGGVAWEVVANLCNRNRSDAWLCVPHRADDEYIRQMARFFKDHLKPERKVYLEFSNEIWNWQFPQAQWMLRDKEAGDGAEAWGYTTWEGSDRAKPTGHPERTAWLFRRCFDIWEKVFDGPSRKRLVRVVAVQNGWFDTVQRTTDAVMAHGGADAVSPSGYFGPDTATYRAWEALGAKLTADQVLDDMDRILETNSKPWIAEYGRLARRHKLRLVNYEGGQHIQPEGQAEKPYNPALAAAQFSPRMEKTYLRNFEILKEAGVDLFCAFASVGRQGTRYGSWGHQETYDTPPSQAPKMRALLEVNAR